MSKLRSAKERANYIVGRHATKTLGTKTGGVIVEKSDKVKSFEGEPYYVSYRKSKTIKRGEYLYDKVEIGITIPCKKDETEKVLKGAIKWVEDKITKTVKQRGV